MSDFLSLTVTVRAPRPSRSRRLCACSAIGTDGLAELFDRGEVDGEGRLGADLLGLGPLDHRPVVDAAGQPVQGRPDGRAQDAGRLGVAQRGELPDGVDAQAVQLLLGDRSDAPQPAHRKGVQQRTFLVAPDHPQPVGLGQLRGDLGDLLARSRPDGGHQPGLLVHPAAQSGAELLDLLDTGTDEFGGLTEGFVERQLLENRAPWRAPCPARVGWPRRRRPRAAAAPPRPPRPGGGPGAWASPSGRRTPGPRSSPRPPRPGRRDRRPAPGRPRSVGRVSLFDGCEERIHVEMQDPALHGWRLSPLPEHQHGRRACHRLVSAKTRSSRLVRDR